MSKYTNLWEQIKQSDNTSETLTFAEIEKILGFSIDHSFLSFKKELLEYGYKVQKISMKEKFVIFCKI